MAERVSTAIRLDAETVQALRLVGAEMSLVMRQPLVSDDARLRALIDHWRKTRPAVADVDVAVVDTDVVDEPAR